MRRSVLLFFLLFSLSALAAAQESSPLPDEDALLREDALLQKDLKTIRMGGAVFGQSFKTLEETIGSNTEDLKYRVDTLGLNYSSFSGARLGFVSDLNILFPLLTKLDSGSAELNAGFLLDYMGGVGWLLDVGVLSLIPYLGFHADYSFLSKDPVDEDRSNHMVSLGLGGGIKMIYNISETGGIVLGLRGSWNTAEFTTADYDSREIQLKRKFDWAATLGYAWKSR